MAPGSSAQVARGALDVADELLVGIPPCARTNAAASSGLAPGAWREYRFGHSAAYPSAANRRTISLVPAS